jgi:hypothetical protein
MPRTDTSRRRSMQNITPTQHRVSFAASRLLVGGATHRASFLACPTSSYQRSCRVSSCLAPSAHTLLACVLYYMLSTTFRTRLLEERSGSCSVPTGWSTSNLEPASQRHALVAFPSCLNEQSMHRTTPHSLVPQR